MTESVQDLIGALPDEDAFEVLALALGLGEPSVAVVRDLAAVDQRLPEAFATTPGIAEIAAPEQGASEGDLARATLRYLASASAEGAASVQKILDYPGREGQRLVGTLAVAGLVMTAMRSEFELKRNAAGKWTFDFKINPMTSSDIAAILAKLWGAISGK